MKLIRLIKGLIPDKIHGKIRGIFKKFYQKKDIETWCVDHIDIEDDLIEVQGWAIAFNKKISPGNFLINGKEFDQVKYPIPRKDIARLFWNIPGALNSGFRCQIKKGDEFVNGHVVLSLADEETKIPFRPEHNYYCDDISLKNKLPIPDSKRIGRVHGNNSEISFLLEGFSNFMKLKLALKENLGRELSDFSSILDWGCGCGRTIRYFNELKNTAITGADIDEDNIKWCQQNLPFASYYKTGKYPPLPFPDLSFDLIIAISVFTHLKEKDQFKWLEELFRISKQGAILLISVHGQEAVRRANLPPDLLLSLKMKGFLDVGANTDLDNIIKDDDYYKNIYHDVKYIEKNWLRNFELLAVIPGCMGNLQDLLIMCKSD